MTTTTIKIPKNDKGFNLSFTITDSDGVVYPLTGYTVYLKVWKLGYPDVLYVNGLCNIGTPPTLGICTYTVVAGDFDIRGKYQAELELTKSGVIESTDFFIIEIMESS